MRIKRVEGARWVKQGCIGAQFLAFNNSVGLKLATDLGVAIALSGQPADRAPGLVGHAVPARFVQRVARVEEETEAPKHGHLVGVPFAEDVVHAPVVAPAS